MATRIAPKTLPQGHSHTNMLQDTAGREGAHAADDADLDQYRKEEDGDSVTSSHLEWRKKQVVSKQVVSNEAEFEKYNS